MKTITIADGREVLVSDEDFDYLVQFNWYAAGRYICRKVDGKHSKLHHEVALRMNLRVSLVDHEDRDTLNNQRENLRIATYSQNVANQSARSSSTYSHYKGVSFCKRERRWLFVIRTKTFRYGEYCKTEREAALAYNAWALRLHGEFALLNEVD